MMVRVKYPDGITAMVRPPLLNELIVKGRIASFRRSDGWAAVGKDPLRGAGGVYHGLERRSDSRAQCL